MASNAQQIKELTAAVAALATGSAAVTASLAEISKNFGDTIKPAKLLGKELDKISGSLEDTIDYNDKIEDQLRSMHRATKELSRVKWLEGVTTPQAKKAIDDQVASMERMALAIDKNSTAYAKLQTGINTLKQAQEDLKKVTTETLDEKQVKGLLTKINEVKDATTAWGKEVDSVDFRRPQAKLTGFGTAMSGVFGGVLGSMKIMDSYGFKNLTNALHKMKREAMDVSKSMKEGGGGYKTAEATKALFAGGRKASDLEKEPYLKMIATKHGEKGALQNLADTGLRKLMENRISGGKGQTLTKMFAQGGGSITEGIGMSSIMSMTKIMGPIGLAITAVGGLLAAFGAVAARKKDTYDALGKGGLLGTGVSPVDAYKRLQGQLSQGSMNPASGFYEKSIMGLNYEKNLSTVKAMVEGGIGVSALGNKNAFAELGGGRATNMMGGIMRNANYFGHNLGMNQEESVALTSKAIGEFNMSFGQTEDLFININRGVTAAGVSTTKYLGVVDNIADQFSRFNKTMGETVLVIQAMGRSGKYTAGYMQEMVNALMGGEKSNEQRAFAFSRMSGQTRQGLVTGAEDRAKEAANEISNLFGVDITKMSPTELRDFTDQHHKNEKVGELVSQYNQSRLAADTWKQAVGKGGNAGALAMAGASQNLGETRQGRAATHTALLNAAIGNTIKGGSIMDLMDPKKAATLMSDFGFGEIAKKQFGVDPRTLAGTYQDAITQAAGTFKDNKIKEYMANDKSKTTPEEKRANAKYQVEKRYGPGTGGVLKDAEFQENIKQGTFNNKIAGVISDTERTAEEEKARANYKEILDPLTFIKNTLKAMLDKIIEMLGVVVDWFNHSLFGSKSEESAKAGKSLTDTGWNSKAGQEMIDAAKKDPRYASLKGIEKERHARNLRDAQELVNGIKEHEEGGVGLTSGSVKLLPFLQNEFKTGGTHTMDSQRDTMKAQRELREAGILAKKTRHETAGDATDRAGKELTASETAAKKAAENKETVGSTSAVLSLDPASWLAQRKGHALENADDEAKVIEKAKTSLDRYQKMIDAVDPSDTNERTRLETERKEFMIKNYYYNVDASTVDPTTESPKVAPHGKARGKGKSS